jgi:predicted small lipoprotein YifL
MIIPFTNFPSGPRRPYGSAPGFSAANRPALPTVALLLILTLAACGGEAPLAPFPRSRSDSNAKADESSPTKASASSSANTGAVSTPSIPSPPPEPPAPPPKPSWQVLLEDGIESYENGAYGNAIRKLEDAADDPQAAKASRVKALKYLAFSYCVSPDPGQSRKSAGHLTLCRQVFERALALDPTFELTQVERGHPVWGRQFQAARIAQSKKNSAAKASGSGINTAHPVAAAASKGGPASVSGASVGTSGQ